MPPKLNFPIRRAGTWAALVLSVGALTSCGGGGSDPGTGSLSVKLTDAPADGAASVVVVFTGIELHRSDGNLVSLDFAITSAANNTTTIALP